jgi:hypothetical protein
VVLVAYGLKPMGPILLEKILTKRRLRQESLAAKREDLTENTISK